MGEAVGERVGEVPIALHKGEGLAGDGDEVEALRVHALPRQAHKAQTGKDVVQTGTLGQTADVVQTGVEANAPAAVALQTAAWHGVPLQHGDALSSLCQYLSADKASEATSNDDYVGFH